MKKQVTFDLNEKAYKYGRADAREFIFDTLYLERSADYSLSYLAGWYSVPLNERESRGGILII